MSIASGASKAGGSVGGAAGGRGGDAGGGRSGAGKFTADEWTKISDEAWQQKHGGFKFGTVAKTAMGVNMLTGGMAGPLGLLFGFGKAMYDFAKANPADWKNPTTQAGFEAMAGGGKEGAGERKAEGVLPLPAIPAPAPAPAPETLGETAPAPEEEEKLSGRKTRSRVNPLTQLTGAFGVPGGANVLRRTLGGGITNLG